MSDSYLSHRDNLNIWIMGGQNGSVRDYFYFSYIEKYIFQIIGDNSPLAPTTKLQQDLFIASFENDARSKTMTLLNSNIKATC